MSIDDATKVEPKEPEAWRVAERVEVNFGKIAYVLAPVYYGGDEDGPKVGDRLVLGKEVKS